VICLIAGFWAGSWFIAALIFAGLTLLGLRDIGVKGMNISNVAARQELRELIRALDLPGVTPNF